MIKGELIFIVAAIVVVYNVVDEKQRHYSMHNEEIQCLASAI